MLWTNYPQGAFALRIFFACERGPLSWLRVLVGEGTAITMNANSRPSLDFACAINAHSSARHRATGSMPFTTVYPYPCRR
jgi:hypothetical protein